MGDKAHHSVRDGVAVHPHLGVHVDQVPTESLTLQPLPQSLPLRDVADINPRVLRERRREIEVHRFTQSFKSINRGLWKSKSDNGPLRTIVQPFVMYLKSFNGVFDVFPPLTWKASTIEAATSHSHTCQTALMLPVMEVTAYSTWMGGILRGLYITQVHNLIPSHWWNITGPSLQLTSHVL